MTQQKRRVLFHRSWTKFNGGTSGGQLKVRDAFEHFQHSDQFQPFVYFGEETIWFDNPGNLWLRYRDIGIDEWCIRPDDILFFAGVDWKILSPEDRQHPPVPVINIAQPRQTDPHDKRHGYLHHPAIRIAKSSLGKQILEDFGVNGPVYCIPDAIDRDLLPALNDQTDLDILVVGLKNPDMAAALDRRLHQFRARSMPNLRFAVQTPPKLPTRQDFLDLLNRARIVAFLPLEEDQGAEGFYLPALEAMAMKKLVICPFAIGNVDFCLADQTCLLPRYTENDIFQAIQMALEMSAAQQQAIIEAGFAISDNHTLDKERQALLDLLHHADEIWSQKDLFQTR